MCASTSRDEDASDVSEGPPRPRLTADVRKRTKFKGWHRQPSWRTTDLGTPEEWSAPGIFFKTVASPEGRFCERAPDPSASYTAPTARTKAVAASNPNGRRAAPANHPGLSKRYPWTRGTSWFYSVFNFDWWNDLDKKKHKFRLKIEVLSINRRRWIRIKILHPKEISHPSSFNKPNANYKKYFPAWPFKKANSALNDWTPRPSNGPTKAEDITTKNSFSLQGGATFSGTI